MAGMIAIKEGKHISTPYFDNLSIRPVGRSKANNTIAKNQARPLYEVK